MNTFSSPTLFILTCLNCLSVSNSGKSLFDELPLNGAITTGNQKLSKQFQPQSFSSLESSLENFVQPTGNGISKNHGEVRLPHGQQASLFDELPNQGAIGSHSPSLTRNTRDSLFTFDSGGSVEFEIRPSKPKSEFDVILGNTILPGVQQSNLDSSKSILRPSKLISAKPVSTIANFLGFTQSLPHSAGRDYRLHSPQHTLPRLQSWRPQQHHHHQSRVPIPLPPPSSHPKLKTHPIALERYNRSFSQVTANAAGPTVIVYANPEGNHRGQGNPVTSQIQSISEKIHGKNEIHYHYHYNNERKNRTKSLKKRLPFKTQLFRGWKSNQNQEHNPNNEEVNGIQETGNEDKPQLKPQPPGESGGYQGSTLRKFIESDETEDDSSSSSEESEEKDETKEEFSTRQLFTNNKRSRARARAPNVPLTYEQPPPLEPIGPPSYSNTYKAPSSSSYEPSPSSTSYEPPPSNSYNPPPSNSYGPPPSNSYEPPPSNSYGPPPSNSYGPPSSPSSSVGPPAPPSNDQPLISEDKYHTTITLQTIPITRQVTELVQVPNIVHQISSSQQNPISSDQPQQDEPPPPPHHDYGPPSPSQGNKGKYFSNNRSKSRLRMTTPPPPPPQFGFQSHLQKLASLTSENPASLLGQSNRNRFTDPELLDLLGLSGSRGLSQFTPLSHQYNNPLLLGPGIFGASRTPQISPGFRQAFPILGGQTSTDSSNVETLKEIIREQRYQNILSDLRSRVREESKSADRARSDYRSLFSKGAFLLSALTLLPRVVSPFAAATAASTSAMNANAFTNALLPLLPSTRRRRKRSIEEGFNFKREFIPQFEFFKDSENFLSRKSIKRATIKEYGRLNNAKPHKKHKSKQDSKLMQRKSCIIRQISS